MKALIVLVATALATLLSAPDCSQAVRYEPTWESLDKRPIPQWYDEAKFGIFLHWGVYSVPGILAWLWELWKGPAPSRDVVEYMLANYKPDFTYADFAKDFTTEFFDPYRWAEIFNASGARYVVLTTKHHEGYCLWPSKYSWNWNAMDVGPNRDLVGELAAAIRDKTSLKFGTYHSLYEFFHPLYLADKKNEYHTQDFVAGKTMPELYELVNRYKPDIVWSDGDWDASSKYWNSTEFIAWLYNDSPVKDTVVTNDRWGNDTRCKHGGYWTCHDKYDPGKIQKHKFEDSTITDKNGWSFRKQMSISDVHTMDELTEILAQVVSSGGNLLLNVGPTKEGTIIPIFEERLRQMGEWLGVNGEAIYGSGTWISAKDNSTDKVWYTFKKGDMGTNYVYAIMLDWPAKEMITLSEPKVTNHTTISMLGYSEPIKYGQDSEGHLVIYMPVIPLNKMPCKWAWVFKLEGLANA